ncbi:MAG: deoxyhypusine synthase [Alphaproteobacteria bacterium]|jgi:deoxyhypusine synthase|nr:deoxyhypusine synthase [Alphaproteobacteria bacterium]PPR14425.1 MAG: Deoxyhypusine synthase-like protein [Alphaproteobacteria bacterium MarineAlpha12_Bin1]
MNIKEKINSKALLNSPIEHIDFTSFDARSIVDSMSKMSFSSRELARAAQIYNCMLEDLSCSIILTIAGSTSAGGCMQIYSDLVRYNMVDVVVASGASIVDMDFFEALGFRHFRGDSKIDDGELRRIGIDRIYDTFIRENDLQFCDNVIADIADQLEDRPYTSREFISHMGSYLSSGNARKSGSLVQTAFEKEVPVFCPAFTDSSAGMGLVIHQEKNPKKHLTIDSVRDFRELTEIKIKSGTTGLLMIGGGMAKNYAQDIVVCAEKLGNQSEMHKYAIQITVADVRDGACSSSTLEEASSWGKVDTKMEQMVFAEATSVMPLLASDAYHRGSWKKRPQRRFASIYKDSVSK